MAVRRWGSSLTALALALAIGTTGTTGCRAAEQPSGTRAAADAAKADVVRLTAGVLEHSQLAHEPLDGQVARTLVARYLDALDGSRSLFLQSDETEFEARSPMLPAAIHAGDSRAAHEVFQRYLARLAQRADFVAETLRAAPPTFTEHEDYPFDRRHADRPRDLEAARALWTAQLRAEYLEQKLQGRPAPEIAKLLAHRYGQQLDTMRGLRSDEILSTYLDTLAHVYDPHSDYMGREDMESFSIAMNLSLFGIGATLEGQDGYCTIRQLTPGGPAARSGLLKPGDRIVAVAQGGSQPVDIVSMPLARAVQLIRGPKGTVVTLTVTPADAGNGAPSKTVALVRDRVKLEDQEAKASVVDLPGRSGSSVRIGVLHLPSFYGNTDGHRGRSASADVARLLGKLEADHVAGVVLDLRDDPGGSLEEAVRVAGLFIRKGPIVQTRDGRGHVEVDSDTDPAVAYDGPLVVLTNRFSASASEIVAGALQDYGRAVVVGDRSTFGKGTVQEFVSLAALMDRMGLARSEDPGAVKVTVSRFYRPGGASTQLRGVASDIVIPSPEGAVPLGESTLDGALPWDHLPAAPYERLDRVRPYLESLKGLSARRVDTVQGLRDVRDEVARIARRAAAQTVSLNETQRREELTKDKEEDAAIERDERDEATAGPVTRPITLENAPSAAPPDADAGLPSAANDIVLHEAERILRDYVEALTG